MLFLHESGCGASFEDTVICDCGEHLSVLVPIICGKCGTLFYSDTRHLPGQGALCPVCGPKSVVAGGRVEDAQGGNKEVTQGINTPHSSVYISSASNLGSGVGSTVPANDSSGQAHGVANSGNNKEDISDGRRETSVPDDDESLGRPRRGFFADRDLGEAIGILLAAVLGVFTVFVFLMRLFGISLSSPEDIPANLLSVLLAGLGGVPFFVWTPLWLAGSLGVYLLTRLLIVQPSEPFLLVYASPSSQDKASSRLSSASYQGFGIYQLIIAILILCLAGVVTVNYLPVDSSIGKWIAAISALGFGFTTAMIFILLFYSGRAALELHATLKGKVSKSVQMRGGLLALTLGVATVATLIFVSAVIGGSPISAGAVVLGLITNVVGDVIIAFTQSIAVKQWRKYFSTPAPNTA